MCVINLYCWEGLSPLLRRWAWVSRGLVSCEEMARMHGCKVEDTATQPVHVLCADRGVCVWVPWARSSVDVRAALGSAANETKDPPLSTSQSATRPLTSDSLYIEPR